MANVNLFRYQFPSLGTKLFHIDANGKRVDPQSTLKVRDTSTRVAPDEEVENGSAFWWFDRVIISDAGVTISPEQMEELRPDTTDLASSSGTGKNAVGITVDADGGIAQTEFVNYFLVWDQDATTDPKTALEIWFSDYDFAEMPDQAIRDMVQQRLEESYEEQKAFLESPE
jgi:hypothetical protein